MACVYVCPVMSLVVTSWTVTCQAPPWNFPSKNTGVHCLFLFQGIFLIQGLNLCLLHWQADFFFFTTEPPIPLTKYLKENVEENSLLPFCKALHAILKNLGINELPLIQVIYHLSALNEQKPLSV